MTKTHTTLTVDSDLLEKAKKLHTNISGEFNAFLRGRIIPTKKDLPEANLKIICSLCQKEITEGYKCPNRDLVLCEECQESYDMTKCQHDKLKEHIHTKFGGFI